MTQQDGVTCPQCGLPATVKPAITRLGSRVILRCNPCGKEAIGEGRTLPESFRAATADWAQKMTAVRAVAVSAA